MCTVIHGHTFESKTVVVRFPFDETTKIAENGNEAAQISSRPVGDNSHNEKSLR